LKLLYITNIPAPYRQKRFNKMAEIFPKHGIELEVLYMAKIEPNRKWDIPEDSYKYNFKIFKGIHPRIGRFFAHFNPGLLLRLMKKDYDIVIVGGMASPTHWLAPFFIPKNRIQVMSIESNLHSVERKTGIGAKIKKLLLSKADAYQVTGNPQKEYIEFFYPDAKRKKYIKLPNLIDEDVFVEKVQNLRKNRKELREKFNVDVAMQMWVLPARLIEIKGIIPFLKLLKNKSGYKLFILGDGELYDVINAFTKKESLNVNLVGFVQQDEVIKYYAASDLFVLPSFKDASPLTPIEASAAKLPLLVSNRIGNNEDVVVLGLNGWSFDPDASSDINVKLIDQVLEKKNNDLKEMGEQSFLNYMKIFDTENCITNYTKKIKNILEGAS
jgi:glycosyltransferase involved in cell wall biosynthesis